nr:uncharacterized protein LOC112424280 isoform X3 [Macaca nemestrina]
MIPALGARGPWFKSQTSPFSFSFFPFRIFSKDGRLGRRREAAVGRASVGTSRGPGTQTDGPESLALQSVRHPEMGSSAANCGFESMAAPVPDFRKPESPPSSALLGPHLSPRGRHEGHREKTESADRNSLEALKKSLLGLLCSPILVLEGVQTEPRSLGIRVLSPSAHQDWSLLASTLRTKSTGRIFVFVWDAGFENTP